MAMLVLLETLTPDERAVFVLREVFGFDYDEIAGAVGKSAATVRQMAHRAREHVHARRKRFGPVDAKRDHADHRAVPDRGGHRRHGRVADAVGAEAPTWTSDHGGKATAIRRAALSAREGWPR